MNPGFEFRSCSLLSVTMLFWNLFVSMASADPPRIVSNREPQSQCIINGQSGSLNVSGQGTTPLRYQWRLNGVDIPNQTNARLAFQPARPEHGGDYQVTIANSE